MKQTTWDGKDVLLVEVPEGALELCVLNNPVGFDCPILEFWVGAIGVHEKEIELPKGNWQFAFASPLSPTEEEAREWVGWHRIDGNVVYRDYENDDIDDYSFDCNTPIESLHSRIRSEGFEQPGRVVILTKTQTNEKV